MTLVSKDWKWPEHAADCPGRPDYKGICACRISTSPAAAIDQLRRDRDELLDALVKLREYVDRLVAPIAAEEPQAVLLVADDLRQVDALLARVKGHAA